MFFAAVIGPAERLRRAHTAIDSHAVRLATTGWSGAIGVDAVAGGFLAWDATSSHGGVSTDPSSGSRLLRAGYLAGEGGWGVDGRHAIELSDASGEFAAVSVRVGHRGKTVWEAFSDPAASWPLYHGRRDSTVVVSNDPHAVGLALGLTELCAQSVYEILAYGHALDAETTIAGVRRLFPGERLRIEASPEGVALSHVEARRRYAYSEDRPPQPRLEYEALDELRRGAAQIGPLTGGRFADATVQLSGGLDSRLTAAILAEVYPERPDTVTLDLSNPDEIAIAREVAERLGFPHRVATLADTDLATLHDGWLLTGGQVSPYAAAGNILSYETASRDAAGRILLVGAWPGDCLIGSYVPGVPEMESTRLRRWVVDEWARKRGRARIGPGGGVSGPEATRVHREAARRLRRRLQQGSGASAAQRISYWAMFSRQPAFSYIAPAMLTSHVLPVTPVLATGYVDRLLQLTSREIIGKNFYRSMIAHGFPALAGIPNASTGRPVDDVPVRPSWAPSSIDELYSRLPVWTQRTAHVIVGVFRRRSAGTIDSVEVGHWEAIFSSEADADEVDAGGIRVRADAASDLHLRAMTRGLRWTSEYLAEGVSRLGGW